MSYRSCTSSVTRLKVAINIFDASLDERGKFRAYDF